MTQWLELVVLIAVVGAVAKVVTDRFVDADLALRITRTEYLVGIAIASVVIVPIVTHVGNAMARGNLLRYDEFYGGFERQAVRTSNTCGRDGSCENTYRCDPYEVTIHHAAVTDAKGHTITPAYDTTETRYHSCPYVTEEHDFEIDTTLGTYTVATGWIDPQPRAWRSGHGVPGDIPRGDPAPWAAARDRIAAGDPGPVTALRKYDNYVLASQKSILRRYDDAIGGYRKAKLLPPPTRDVHDLYQADKATVLAAGVDQGKWNDAVARFDAGFGTELQGDLRVVLVPAAKVSKPDEYTGALAADWESKRYGKRAISKNTLIVVVGVSDDGSRSVWVRAFTGMPLGNEAMLTEIRSGLVDLPLADPYKFLGHPIGHPAPTGFKATLTHTDGALEDIVWGPHRFTRVCMRCAKPGQHGGFTYLKGEITPTSGQHAAIAAVAVLLSLVVWAVLLFVGPTERVASSIRQRRNRDAS